MRMVSRRFVSTLAAFAVCGTMIWTAVILEERAMLARRAKVRDLDRVAATLRIQKASLAQTLALMGTPTSIKTLRLPKPPSAAEQHHRMTLTYSYMFRGLPWKLPHEATLEVDFEGTIDLSLTSAGTKQSWSN
jgi:hypothetical protein